jgi:hypothetical protein
MRLTAMPLPTGTPRQPALTGRTGRKSRKAIWILLFLAAGAAAGSGAERREPDIVVCLHHGNVSAAIVAPAEAQAQRMLASVGISVAWRLGTPNYHGRAEVIEAVLAERAAEDFRPGALAFASLGVQAGTRIEILYNRVQASGPAAAVPSILAHVLVHEITHVLEGVSRHSESGVMKAHWDPEDFRHMRSSLPFAAEDIRLIHAWTERHNQTLLAAVR